MNLNKKTIRKLIRESLSSLLTESVYRLPGDKSYEYKKSKEAKTGWVGRKIGDSKFNLKIGSKSAAKLNKKAKLHKVQGAAEEKKEAESAVDNFMAGLDFGNNPNETIPKASVEKKFEKFKKKIAKKQEKSKEKKAVDDFFAGLDFGDAAEGDKVKAKDLEKLVADKIEDSNKAKAVDDFFAGLDFGTPDSESDKLLKKSKPAAAVKKKSDDQVEADPDVAGEFTFDYDELDNLTARSVIKRAYEHFIKVKKQEKDPKYKTLIRDIDRRARGYRESALDDTKGGIYSEFLGSKVREEMLDYFDDNANAASKYLKVKGKQYDLNDAFVSYTDHLRKKFSKTSKEQLGSKAKESNYGDDENQEYSREKYLKESKSYGLSRGSLYRLRYRRY